MLIPEVEVMNFLQGIHGLSDRIFAVPGARTMGCDAPELHAEPENALMAVRDTISSAFRHHQRANAWQVARGSYEARTFTSRLFPETQDDDDASRGGVWLLACHQHRSDAAFHVRGATSKKAPAFLPTSERIVPPCGLSERDRVKVRAESKRRAVSDTARCY
jgi:hypothetical protein